MGLETQNIPEEVEFTTKKENGAGPTPDILKDRKTLRERAKVSEFHFVMLGT